MTIDPTSTPQWQALAAHFDDVKDLHLRQLFSTDPERAVRLTAQAGDLVLVKGSLGVGLKLVCDSLAAGAAAG